MLIAAEEIAGWYSISGKKYKTVIAGLGLVALVFMSFTAFYRTWGNGAIDEMEICRYAEEEKVSKVYFLNDSTHAEICRLLGYENEGTVYLSVGDNGQTYIYDYYKKYDGVPIEFENSILVIPNAQDYEESMEMFGHQYHKCATAGSYVIFS